MHILATRVGKYSSHSETLFFSSGMIMVLSNGVCFLIHEETRKNNYASKSLGEGGDITFGYTVYDSNTKRRKDYDITVNLDGLVFHRFFGWKIVLKHPIKKQNNVPNNLQISTFIFGLLFSTMVEPNEYVYEILKLSKSLPSYYNPESCYELIKDKYVMLSNIEISIYLRNNLNRREAFLAYSSKKKAKETQVEEVQNDLLHVLNFVSYYEQNPKLFVHSKHSIEYAVTLFNEYNFTSSEAANLEIWVESLVSPENIKFREKIKDHVFLFALILLKIKIDKLISEKSLIIESENFRKKTIEIKAVQEKRLKVNLSTKYTEYLILYDAKDSKYIKGFFVEVSFSNIKIDENKANEVKLVIYFIGNIDEVHNKIKDLLRKDKRSIKYYIIENMINKKIDVVEKDDLYLHIVEISEKNI